MWYGRGLVENAFHALGVGYTDHGCVHIFSGHDVDKSFKSFLNNFDKQVVVKSLSIRMFGQKKEVSICIHVPWVCCVSMVNWVRSLLVAILSVVSTVASNCLSKESIIGSSVKEKMVRG